jgi:hypothetical protein
MNLLIKKIKRVGHGFRSFENYRLRLLLRCGAPWLAHSTRRTNQRLGLERVRVLEVAGDSDGRLHLAIETTDDLVGCRACGVRARAKDRDLVEFADLPVFGSPVRLVWAKRRWSCPSRSGAGTWTEQRSDIAPARAALTTRAGLWATREVGAEVHTVAYVARRLGVTWHTVMDAVAYWGQALVDDPDRVGQTTAVGWMRPSSSQLAVGNRPAGPAPSAMSPGAA